MAYEGMLAETVVIHGHNDDEVEAYYARPLGSGPYPGVVVIHHAPGWDEWTREVVRKLAQHGYAAIAPHLYHRSGPGDPIEIAALTQAYRVPVCGHVVPEVHVHLLAAVPNGYMVEYMPRSAAILQTSPVLEDGHLVAPSAPGLGLELDETAIQRFRVA